jgi:hypothetical protein
MSQPKRKISLRVEEELLDMLDKAGEQKGMFWGRDRTWLIEYAIKQTYESVVTPLQEEAPPIQKTE